MTSRHSSSGRNSGGADPPARKDEKEPRYFPIWLRQCAEAIIWTLKTSSAWNATRPGTRRAVGPCSSAPASSAGSLPQDPRPRWSRCARLRPGVWHAVVGATTQPITVRSTCAAGAGETAAATAGIRHRAAASTSYGADITMSASIQR